MTFYLPPSLYKSLFLSFLFTSHLISKFYSPPPPFFSFSGFSMVKTCRGSAFRPRVRSCRWLQCSSSCRRRAAAAPPAAAMASPAAAQSNVAVGSSDVAPGPRRYHTRVGPTPPSLPHPRPSRRGPPSKRAQTSGPGESSSFRPQEPQSPPH